VHPETTAQPHRLLRALADADVVRGVALTPSQSLAILEPLLDEVELVLVLGVDPGRRDPMAPSTAARVAAVREMTAAAGTLVGIDGGVTDASLDLVAALDCDLVVAGSAVFAGPGGPGTTARRFLERLSRVAA
jgi:ribulose-phosphate 3-epimerase